MKKLAPDHRKRFKFPSRPIKPPVIEASRDWHQVATQTLLFCWKHGRSSLVSHPHIYLVSIIFLVLFIWDFVNFITFISLGFFSVLLSDHLIDNLKGYWKKYKARSPARDPVKEEATKQQQNTAAILKLSKRKGISHSQNKSAP